MNLGIRNDFVKDRSYNAKRLNKLKKRFWERIHTLQRITVPTEKNFNSLLSGYWNLDKLPEHFFTEFNDIAIEWVKLTKILKEKCNSEEHIKLFHEKISILTQYFACLIAKDKATLKFLQSGFKTWSFVLANVPKDILRNTVAANINDMSQIFNKLCQAGHYPTQMIALEVLLMYLDFDETDRKYVIDFVIADGFESIRLMLKGFDVNNFDLECRKFLNHVNKNVSDKLRVLSVRFLCGFMEQTSIKHPIVKEKKLELWADFNSTNQTVSFFCNCKTFGESDSNYVVLIEADIKEITFNKAAKVITIRTKNPPKCDQYKFDTCLNEVTNITLYCDNNVSYDEFCEFTKKLEIDIEDDDKSVATVLDTITDRGNITTSGFSLSSTPIKNLKNAHNIIQYSKIISPEIKNTCSKATNVLQYENYLPPRRGSFTDNFSEPNANECIEDNCIPPCPPLNNCNEDSDLFNNSNFSSNIPPTQKFHVNPILTDQLNCQASNENSHQKSLNTAERLLNRENDQIFNSSKNVIHKLEENSGKKANELLTFTKLKPPYLTLVPLNTQIKNKTLNDTENVNNGNISASYPRSATKRKLYNSPHDNIYLSAGSQDTTIQRRKYLDNKRRFEEQQKKSFKNLIPKINVEQTDHSHLSTDENSRICHLDENEVKKRRLSIFNGHEKENITKNIKKINLTADSSGRKFLKSEKTTPYVNTGNSIIKETKNSGKFSYRRGLHVETETVISEKFIKPSSIRKPKKQQNKKSEKLPSIPTRARLERAKKPTTFKFSDSEDESESESESDEYANLNKKRKKNPCKTQNSKQLINYSRNSSNNSKYVNLTDEKKELKIPDKNAISQRRVVNYEIESTISRNIDGKCETRQIFTKTEIEEKVLYAIPEEPKWILEKYFNCLASEQQSSENLNEYDDSISYLSNHDNTKNDVNNENNEKILSMDISPILSVNVETSPKSDSPENVLNENISDIDIEVISNNNFENNPSENGQNISTSTFVIPTVPQKRKSNGHADSVSKKLKKLKDNQMNNFSNCANDTANTANENRIFNTISTMYKLRMDNVANGICNELTNKYNFKELTNKIGNLIEDHVTYQEQQQSIAEPLLAKIEKLTEELNKERKALYETLRESHQCTSKMHNEFGKLLKMLDKNKANAYKSFHEYMKDISEVSKRNMQEIWNNYLDGAAKNINHIFENNLNF